jgi:hypothetical protein
MTETSGVGTHECSAEYLKSTTYSQVGVVHGSSEPGVPSVTAKGDQWTHGRPERVESRRKARIRIEKRMRKSCLLRTVKSSRVNEESLLIIGRKHGRRVD